MILAVMTCATIWTPCALGSDAASALKVVAPRCEYLNDPVGIDETAPRLSWRVESDERGQKQTAYRLLVASSPTVLERGEGDLWDSGRVDSNRTIHVEYNGKPLESTQKCFWKVKVWDCDGVESAWSKPACWSMGLLKASDWSARYISFRDETPIFKARDSLFLPPVRNYRTEFSADKKVKRATVYATALGIYEMEINGKQVGDAYFAPGWTDYLQRAYYKAYDVTDLIQKGENAIGASVADGWYAGYVAYGLLVGIGTEKIGRYTYGKTPSFMAQLEIEYEDGSREVVGTNRSWKVTDDGPIREADLLMGEFYDARKEMPGWSTAGFDDSGWDNAILAEDSGHPTATFYEAGKPGPSGQTPKIEGFERDLGFRKPKLEAFPGVPVRVTQEIRPINITKRDEGTYIFNLGQNFAGNIRLKVKGPAGHRITLRYGEMLHPDGRLMTENLRKARATDYYVCKGDEQGEVYTPRFTFHGFQYVELSDFPGKPDLDTITGLVLHSDTPLTSSFECSDPMVNKLFSNVVWTQRANFVDLPTDCPQRDERMGWTGDAQAYVGTAVYNGDVAAFFTKWLRELMESQRPSGAFPGFAPFPFHRGWDFGTAWADAGIICPWTVWQAYDDTRVIDRCWQPMSRFMQWRKRTSVDELGVVHGNGWGDWLNQGEVTPLDYIDSAYFALTTRMMAEMAKATERNQEAAAYREQFKRTKVAFGKKYLNADGSLKVKTQTAYALALFADLVPDEMRNATGQHLADLLQFNGNHMATGFLGTRPLLPVLSSAGQHDLAVFLLQSHEFPSWGYEIDQGATSIWERWDSYTKEDGFGRHNAAMNSFAHYSFGAVCEWMFRTLAGIDSDGPGYSQIIIRPDPPAPDSNGQHKPIDWVKASYHSIQGKILSNWKVEGDRFHLAVTIPANTTATVFMPATDAKSITEGGRPLSEVKHVKPIGQEGDRVVLSVDSGTYRFESTGGIQPAKEAITTSKPADRSLNPEAIDLTDARELVRWDFREEKDATRWMPVHSIRLEKRGEKAFVVGAGDDPQFVTELSEPLSGPLVLELKARPAKGAGVQFFWASPAGGFNARQQTRRQLNPANTLNAYLFRIDDREPLGKLRFDPFSGQGEMEVESLAIYRLTKQ